MFITIHAIVPVSDEDDHELFKTWVLLDDVPDTLESNQEVVSTMSKKTLDLSLVVLQVVTLELSIDAMMVCHRNELLEWLDVRLEVLLSKLEACLLECFHRCSTH